MKSTEILDKIKTFLGEEKIEQIEETQLEEQVEESTEKVELAQAKLDNGTVLEAEAFEAGNEIFIVTEDERVAVPVGEYQMEDGQGAKSLGVSPKEIGNYSRLKQLTQNLNKINVGVLNDYF